MYQWDVKAVSGHFPNDRWRWLGYVVAHTRGGAEAAVADRGLSAELRDSERLKVVMVGLYIDRPGRLN